MSKITLADLKEVRRIFPDPDKREATLDIFEKYVGARPQLREKIRKYESESKAMYAKPPKGEKIGYLQYPERGRAMLKLLSEISQEMNTILKQIS